MSARIEAIRKRRRERELQARLRKVGYVLGPYTLVPEQPTLRDEFAMHAAQGLLAGHIAHYGHENHWPWASLMSEAFDVADAAMKARQS